MTERSIEILSDTGLPEHESVRLLMVATSRSRSDVILGFDVPDDQAKLFDTFVERRLADEPLQYIEGTIPFGPVELRVDDRVLVPRPETEYMFELAVEAVDRPAVVVDLCCGSGNLALAMAATFPAARTYAVDISEAAAQVAAMNARRNNLDIHILVGDLYDPLPESLHGSIDLLVANPPYLATHEIDSLPADVLREPTVALRAGVRGDEIVERIGAQAGRWLAPGGFVFCEISEFGAERFLEHFRDLNGAIIRDLAGKPRFVAGRKPSTASGPKVG